MFGIGGIGSGEILVIVVLALLLFGPRRIPEIGRSMGKALAQFRRASHEFRAGLEREVEAERLKEAGDVLRSVRSRMGEAANDVRTAVSGAAIPPVKGESSADESPTDGRPGGLDAGADATSSAKDDRRPARDQESSDGDAPERRDRE